MGEVGPKYLTHLFLLKTLKIWLLSKEILIEVDKPGIEIFFEGLGMCFIFGHKVCCESFVYDALLKTLDGSGDFRIIKKILVCVIVDSDGNGHP